MLLRVIMIERLDNLMTSSKIGLIEVKNLTASDSQKIFNIINSEGEKLTAVEVLSAKPSWNTTISHPSLDMEVAVTELYKKIGAENSDIVKWDLPATLLHRIPENFVVKSFGSDPKEFAKQITYGFKLLAGIWCKGIKKEDIEALSKLKNINWEDDYEKIINDLTIMLTLMGKSSYFSFFSTWRTTIMELTSDSIALNFFILCYMDWERKGKPSGNDQVSRQFQKNCFILWDKLIYEYTFSLWRGSSDSRVAANIAEISHAKTVYTEVSQDKWVLLMEEIRDKYSINEAPLSQKNMTPILYHYYCLMEMQGPDGWKIEVDHIIPQAAFKNLSDDKMAHADSLYNFALLPKKDNISKSNKRLNEVHDVWLKSQILKYEFIEEKDFAEYSDVANYSALYQKRAKRMIEEFTTKRDFFINN